MRRRDGLAAALALPLAQPAMPQPVAARAGFDIPGLTDTLRALGFSNPVPSRDLLLEAPDLAENGAQVRVELSCKMPNVKRLYLLAEKNPAALVAWFEMSDAVEARMVINLKLAQSSWVYGLALLSDNKLLMAQKDVKVTLGGCAA
jgi:sulfur-oxidizing protein SoxY